MTKIEELDFTGKRVLVRVDFNVPLKEGQVIDPTRIEAALQTITYILKRGGRLILMSHLGRPKGKRDPAFSLTPCATALAALLEQEVDMAPDCIGPKVTEMAKRSRILLLENLRFYEAETKPERDPNFAKELASLGDIYIDDAFGCAHRSHSSISEVPKYFPDQKAAGFLIRKEVETLDALLQEPKRPFAALIGGAKVSSKIGLLRTLAQQCDILMVGGAMANTFLKAQGCEMGHSLVEPEEIENAKAVMQSAKKLLLPIDIVATKELKEDADSRVAPFDGLHKDEEGVDIGPETVKLFSAEIAKAKTLLWNGPVGVYEMERFAKGTHALAEAVAKSGCESVVGGGDSIAAIKRAKLEDQISHISTGGGATLAYLERGTLPGLDSLKH
ncbi:MAG: Phosphoglycerate kinase [Chlamydiales bacterium]|nr:Phosphoglycerate kinase [Chlamydiales bacterium]MCH9636198.1 Phosphoglycerate kinase [Chlamydiales bacterium]